MDKNFKLSNYQENIINFVRNQRGNLLVDAKAGSGKTSTLLLLADELTAKGNKCLFLAFNKHIVEELSEKISDTQNCIVKTVHSLGYSFIASYLYKKHGKDNFKLETDDSKLRNLVRDYYDMYFRQKIDLYNATGLYDEEDLKSIQDIDTPVNQLDDKALKQLHNDIISDFVGLCRFSRLYNVNYKQAGALDKLVDRFCWKLSPFVNDVLADYQDLVIAVIDKTKELFENPEIGPDNKPLYKIDFTDMIYFPVYYNMTIPYSVKQYIDTVLIDESQDLSVLQQKFIQMLNTNFNRFIFVGDKFQSIYGFGGADTHALEKLDETFILQHLPLSICYRCPENIVKLAKEIVPTIEWNTAREDKGIVELITIDDVIKNIQPNEVLIGRKNKDLIKLYRMFTLTLKKSVKFKNRELVNTLVNNIEKVITEYINLYIKGVNIQKPLTKHMAEFVKNTGQISGTELYEAEYKDYSRKLVDKNTGKSGRVMRSNYTMSYLIKCMQEYKELGAYGEQEDDQLTEFYDVIFDFINEFTSEHSAKILVDDFKLYIKTFLSGNIYADVPIISSVHAMKGGEADTVYIYDYPLFPYIRGNMSDDDEQQERNLQYVAITRAKKNLYLVKSDDPR